MNTYFIEKEDLKAIAYRIRVYRRELKMNQTEFGRRFGLTQAQVTYLERGESDELKYYKDVVKKIACDDADLYNYLMYGESGPGGKETEAETDEGVGSKEEVLNKVFQLGYDLDSGLSVDQVIDNYFKLYPEKKQALAALIKTGKFEKILELFDLKPH